MQFLRYLGSGLVVVAVLLVAPVQCSPVQIRNIPEDPTHQEVFLYKTDQPLHFAFGKWMPRLTELRLESTVFIKAS